MGDDASGDIARRRWMVKDAGRKQQHINMESKKCCDLVIFDFNFCFCNNSLKDSSNQQHLDNIYCVFISRSRYYIYLIIVIELCTVIHVL